MLFKNNDPLSLPYVVWLRFANTSLREILLDRPVTLVASGVVYGSLRRTVLWMCHEEWSDSSDDRS
jgi:hypothetical protein